MTSTEIQHICTDLEILKKDVAIIKHIISEEGELTENAKKLLAQARKTPRSRYVSHEELKKKLLK